MRHSRTAATVGQRAGILVPVPVRRRPPRSGRCRARPGSPARCPPRRPLRITGSRPGDDGKDAMCPLGLPPSRSPLPRAEGGCDENRSFPRACAMTPRPRSPHNLLKYNDVLPCMGSFRFFCGVSLSLVPRPSPFDDLRVRKLGMRKLGMRGQGEGRLVCARAGFVPPRHPGKTNCPHPPPPCGAGPREAPRIRAPLPKGEGILTVHGLVPFFLRQDPFGRLTRRHWRHGPPEAPSLPWPLRRRAVASAPLASRA